MAQARLNCKECGKTHLYQMTPNRTMTLRCPETGKTFQARAERRSDRASSKHCHVRSEDVSAESRSSDLNLTEATSGTAKLEQFIRENEIRAKELGSELKKVERAPGRIEVLRLDLRVQFDAFRLKELDRLRSKIENIHNRKIVVLRSVERRMVVRQGGLIRGPEYGIRLVDVSVDMTYGQVEEGDNLDRKNCDLFNRLREIETELLRREKFLVRMDYQKLDRLEPDPIYPLSINTRILKMRELQSLRSEGDIRQELTSLWMEIDNCRKKLQGTSMRNGDQQISPPRRNIAQWMDAEKLACDYMRWLGYQDARCTQGGADGGVDVDGSSFVAQVKMLNRAVSAPEIRQLYGAATARSKAAIFFAISYSAPARKFARSVGVRLFEFTLDGTIREV